MAQEGENTKLYITKKSQICYDRILEKDLYTATKPTRKWNKKKSGGASRAAAVTSKIWPKNTLRVFFLTKSLRENNIMEWANMWSQHADIKFEKTILIGQSDIRVGFNPTGGAWSYLGTDSTQKFQTMNLGFIDQATVLHEFGHALGFIHEHQSPANGGYEWNEEAVIESLSGPPNNWDEETIYHNMFATYNEDQLNMTEYDVTSIMHYPIPPEWIEGDEYPNGTPYNTVLSANDKKLVAQLYGAPSQSAAMSNTSDTSKMDTLPVFYPQKVTLKSSGDKATFKFHTSTDKEPKVYTICTMGEIDTTLSLLGPTDPDNYIMSDDNSGDGQNAKIEEALYPDKDYFIVVRTFEPKGGEFHVSITAI